MAKLRLFGWLRSLTQRRWRIVATVAHADEVPALIAHNGAVLVGTRRRAKWLAFDCPCRSGHRILLPLDSRCAPHWRLSRAGGLTLRPSIDAKGSVGQCHFFLRRGRIIWIDRSTE
jgi:hypothetical protein